MIELHGVTKRFGAVRALDGVSLVAEQGSTVAIFGANGSGKSTLLRIAAGLIRPTSGSIVLEGGDPRSVKAKLGYLGHASYLYPYLSALENLRFYARLYRVDENRAKELIWRIGLPNRIDAQARTLSRGETQRLGLARALINDPDYLLLDEPLSGLDQAAAEDFPTLVARKGRTILMTTHDLEAGTALADRCVTLDNGRLLAS